jgi:hypothetical protein
MTEEAMFSVKPGNTRSNNQEVHAKTTKNLQEQQGL